jgi:putative DNA primase/helicase
MGSALAAGTEQLLAAYEEFGYKLVKVNRELKKPTYDDWQLKTIPPDEMREWVANGGNVGIQAGEVSDWICAADLDSEEAVRLAPTLLPESLRSGKQETPTHWVYRSPGARYLQFRDVDRDMLIELKASENGAGHQFVVEPSIHPEKGPYRWIPGFNPALIAEVSKEELEKRLRHLALATLIVRNFPPDGGHDYALCLCGYLLRNGMTYEDLEHVLNACWPADKARHHNIAGALKDTDAKLKRDEPVRGGRTLEELAPGLPRALAKALGWEKADNRDGRRTYLCTEFGNAQRFADQHGSNFRYVHPWRKWLGWDSRRWKIDDTGAAERCAKETVRSIFEEAAKAAGDDQAKELGKWALQSQSATRLHATLELAKSEPGIPVTPNELDRGAWFLNVLNGTIDLRTGDLLEHRREDLITKLAPVEFDPNAHAPVWQATLERVLPNPKIRAFFKRLCGYAITGDTSEHVLPMLYGTGANGKSTVLNALLEALGDYAMQAAPDLLIAKRNSHPTELADLFGGRLVASIEVEDGRRLAESLVKQLTGGDRVKARRMRQDFWEFTPTHKVLMAVNHKPIVRGTDTAIWRRIRLIPFTETIPPAEQDKKLPEKLKAELPGILAWAVEGCLEWQRSGLQAPDEVRKATGEYRSEMDVLGAFLKECCAQGPDEDEAAGDLYKAYRMWCEDGGERPETQRKFGSQLRERGFERYRGGSAGGHRWRKVSLLTLWKSRICRDSDPSDVKMTINGSKNGPREAKGNLGSEGSEGSAKNDDPAPLSGEPRCKHDAPGGCWLCKEKIDKLVWEGVSPAWARAEVLEGRR